MALARVATMWAPRSHVLSGRWLSCRKAPAVTDVGRRHPAHSDLGRLRSSARAFRAAARRTDGADGRTLPNAVLRAGAIVG
jgi:hypothetical protein